MLNQAARKVLYIGKSFHKWKTGAAGRATWGRGTGKNRPTTIRSRATRPTGAMILRRDIRSFSLRRWSRSEGPPRGVRQRRPVEGRADGDGPAGQAPFVELAHATRVPPPP